jgi:hypothetical protein
VLLELEANLGLTPGTPLEKVLEEAERRRPGCGAAVRHALEPETLNFVSSLNELETACDDFSQRRTPR